MFAPYDQPTYQAVRDLLRPDDVVLDIGAGDLRLSRQMAGITRRVYALEISAALLEAGSRYAGPLPANLVLLCADARTADFPADITTGVLLMRHCMNFRLYAGKLQASGAARLITNARWHMSVELVELLAGRLPYDAAGMGWYACLCGATGFKEGPAEQWSPGMDAVQHEVTDCPQCKRV